MKQHKLNNSVTTSVSSNGLDDNGTSYWIKIFAYLAVYIGWGTTFLAIKVGVRDISPSAFLMMRFGIAALCLALATSLMRQRKNPSLREIAGSGAQGLLLMVAGLLPIAYAERHLASGYVSLIIGCAPIFFALFDKFINGTPIGRWTAIGTTIGLTGVAYLSLTTVNGNSPHAWTSIALALFGTAAWSFASVAGKKLRVSKDAFVGTLVQYFVATLALAVIAFLGENFTWTSLDRCGSECWYSLIYLALVPSLLTFTAYLWLLRHEPSQRVATYAFVTPVVGVLCGAFFLGEPLNQSTYVSLVLILAGTYFTTKEINK